MRALLPLLLISLLSACAHDLALMKKDETLNGYRTAIRWSEFERAQGFQSERARHTLSTAEYGRIRVTRYSVLSQYTDKERMLLKQRVEIDYYLESDLRERSLKDEETWRYDDDLGKWVLDSDLPHFK